MILLDEITEFTFCTFVFVCEAMTTSKNMIFNTYHQNNSIRPHHFIFICLWLQYMHILCWCIYTVMCYKDTVHVKHCSAGVNYELMHIGLHYCYVHYTFYLYSVKNWKKVSRSVHFTVKRLTIFLALFFFWLKIISGMKESLTKTITSFG